jgi:hypothetical protein
MSSEDVKVLLEDLVSSYRAYRTDEFRDIEEGSERKMVQDKAERSAAALNSLFGTFAQYSEKSLSREGQSAAMEIVKELECIVEDVQQKRPGGLGTTKWSGTADTVEELTSELDKFIRVTTQDGSPVLWPFVSIIRVYLRSLFLRTGIILADLPGVSSWEGF